MHENPFELPSHSAALNLHYLVFCLFLAVIDCPNMCGKGIYSPYLFAFELYSAELSADNTVSWLHKG